MNIDLPLKSNPFRDGRIGIIDIGSNSIRLVVYDQLKRAPVAIYNEKVMCELGKGLATSGVLNPEGVTLAKEALQRFLALGRNMEITSLYVMATAAIRDAKDGERLRAIWSSITISTSISSRARKRLSWGRMGCVPRCISRRG